MSWQDREYAQNDYSRGPGRISTGGFVWPKPSSVVKRLLIANILVFVCYNILKVKQFLEWGALSTNLIFQGQLWRLISYQYLHAGGWHIFMNMLGLYFLGSILERRWGGRKFFLLYTLFGIVGGVFFILLTAAGVLPWGTYLIGASGSVLGLVGACAVAAPQITVIFFIFPLPIRTAAIILGVMAVLNILNTGDGGEACHLGGLAFGALWAWLEGRGVIKLTGRPNGTIGPSGRKWVHTKIRKGAWDKKMKRQQMQQGEIDRILKKIHDKGLSSLSRSEKKILQNASQDRPDYNNV